MLAATPLRHFQQQIPGSDDYIQEMRLMIKVWNGKNSPANKQQLKTCGTGHSRC